MEMNSINLQGRVQIVFWTISDKKRPLCYSITLHSAGALSGAKHSEYEVLLFALELLVAAAVVGQL